MFIPLSSAADHACEASGHPWCRRLAAGSTRIAAALMMTLLLLAHNLLAQAPGADEEGEMERWLATTAHQEATISPGTRITTENWRQYRQFMPMGMQELYSAFSTVGVNPLSNKKMDQRWNLGSWSLFL